MRREFSVGSDCALRSAGAELLQSSVLEVDPRKAIALEPLDKLDASRSQGTFPTPARVCERQEEEQEEEQEEQEEEKKEERRGRYRADRDENGSEVEREDKTSTEEQSKRWPTSYSSFAGGLPDRIRSH